MSLQAEERITTNQPTHTELTSEQTTAPADITPEPEPSAPPQPDEPTEAQGTNPAVTEPPTDPTPPEPSILDIFDDA